MADNSEHCWSYYAATRNDHSEYPSLEGSIETDVCVIGGGFTGVATALGLAERGYQVVLLEQHRIGWGASGRNGGQMIGGISGEGTLLRHHRPQQAELIWDIGWRGNQIIAERVGTYDIDCDLRYGYIDVALKPRHMRDFTDYYEQLQGHGHGSDAELLDRDALREILDTEAYIGGLINRRSGHLHPLNLCLGEARAAVSLGVRLFEQSEVTAIVHGAKPLVRTTLGEVKAETVILAGNAYHRLEQQHLSGLLFPAGSFIIATEPLGEAEAQRLNPQNLAVCDPNHVLDYFRLSADRRLLFGGRCNYSGRVPRSIQGNIRPRMLKIFPQLADKRIDYEWGGNIGIVINRAPLLGRIGDNVFYAQGYSGHGVNFSHVAAEILTDAIQGQLERFDIFTQIPHRRFPFGQKFGNQIIALGMLYYRIKDLL